MPHIKGAIEFDCDFDALAEEMEKSGYVKVVRCKDCIHRPLMEWNEAYGDLDVLAPEVDGKEDWRCPCVINDDPYYSWSPNDNWFCASGERREGNADVEGKG